MNQFCKLYSAANTFGIKIRPWLLVRHTSADKKTENGYWFNKANSEKAGVFAKKFIQDFRAHPVCRSYTLDWLTFDMESPKRLSLELNVFDDSQDGVNGNTDIEVAIREYTKLVNELKTTYGVQVHAVASHFVLHESTTGDLYRLQDAKSIPFLGIPWSEISFMAYKAEFEDKAKQAPLSPQVNFSSGITYEYAKRTFERFGAANSYNGFSQIYDPRIFGPDFEPALALDLGEVGKVFYPVPFDGLLQPFEVYFDLKAVKDAGISSVHFYSLDGLIGMLRSAQGRSITKDSLKDFTEQDIQYIKHELVRFFFPSLEDQRQFERRFARQESHLKMDPPSAAAVSALDSWVEYILPVSDWWYRVYSPRTHK